MAETLWIIRPMTLDDLPGVFRIGEQCFAGREVLSYGHWSLAEAVHHFVTWGELCFVAESNGEMIGFALGANQYCSRRIGHLQWVAVAYEDQRQEIAAQLAEVVYTAMRAQGLHEVISDVSESDLESLGFFSKQLHLERTAVINFFKKDL